jgi:hypothetical protein
MNQAQRIADAYHAVTLKDSWYGPPLAKLLAKVSPQIAITPPVPGAHTISALLQHLLLWNERARTASETQPFPPWNPDKEWAEPPIPWIALLARWNQSRDLLEARIRNFPAEDLPKQLPGRDYPYETMFEGIVQHIVWHAGQIAMISSLLHSRSI